MYLQQKEVVGIPSNQQVVKRNLFNFAKDLLAECENTLNEPADLNGANKTPRNDRSDIRTRAYGNKAPQRRDRRHRQEQCKFIL